MVTVYINWNSSLSVDNVLSTMFDGINKALHGYFITSFLANSVCIASVLWFVCGEDIYQCDHFHLSLATSLIWFGKEALGWVGLMENLLNRLAFI